MGTKNYVVDDRCIVPPEIKMLSAAELAEKIAEYEQVLPPLKKSATVRLPQQNCSCAVPRPILHRKAVETMGTARFIPRVRLRLL